MSPSPRSQGEGAQPFTFLRCDAGEMLAAKPREEPMNPFRWTLLHRLAWFIISVAGAVAGLLCAYIASPFLFAPEGWGAFEAWLASPGQYWAWVVGAFFATALLFYLAQLVRSSN